MRRSFWGIRGVGSGIWENWLGGSFYTTIYSVEGPTWSLRGAWVAKARLSAKEAL
jgi:hypothetical protein